MKNTEKIYQLVCAISLGGKQDSIGIPIYSCYPSNGYFLSATDDKLKIKLFHDLMGFENNIVRLQSDELERTEYIEGDLSPIVIFSNGNPKVISGDTIEDLIENLKSISENSSDAIEDAVSQLESILEKFSGGQYPPPPTQLELEHLQSIKIEPKAARLWLDNVTGLLPSRNSVISASNKDTKNEIRLALLTWANEIAIYATSPIFEYFVNATSIANREGVYTEDIFGTAIVRRIAENIARNDRIVDLIRNFRRTYGRGPLASVQELSQKGLGEFSRKASESLDYYYEYVVSQLKSDQPYRILHSTFAADSGDQWPASVRAVLTQQSDKWQRTLDGLLEERTSLLGDLEKQSHQRDYARVTFLTRQNLNENIEKINDAIGLLDALKKSNSDRNRNMMAFDRFESIDYRSLNLNPDFFASLPLD